MAKSRLRFNKQTLELREEKKSFSSYAKKFFWFLATGVVFGLFFFWLSTQFVDTPKEKMLKREIAKFELQYDNLNKRMAQLSEVLGGIEERDDYIYRTMFEADPIDPSVRQAGIGGSNPYQEFENYNHTELFTKTQKKIDALSNRLYIESKSMDEIIELVKNKEEFSACIPAIQPVSKDKSYLASGYGLRKHPILHKTRMHKGIDFAAPRNTPIYATGNGKVVKAQRNSGYGNCVVIDHGFGYKTLYAHMLKYAVRPGQKVKRGQVIGYVGSTGLSVAPHVHYEILKNGKNINPITYFYQDLTPEEYEIVIEQAAVMNKALS